MIAQMSRKKTAMEVSVPLVKTILLSSCIAFLPNVAHLVFVMASLPFFYRKKWALFMGFIIPQLLHLFVDTNGTYLFLVYLIGYLSFASIVRMCRGNFKISMNLFQLVIGMLFSIQTYHQKSIFVVMVLMQLIFMSEEDEQMCLRTLVIGSLGVLMYYLMPQSREIYLVLSLIFLCLKTNVKMSSLMYFVYYLFFGLSPFLFAEIILLNQIRQHRLLFIGVLICFVILMELSWIEIIISTCCCGLMLCYSKKENHQMIQHQDLLTQQLEHFSTIFKQLSVYYENLSTLQATFLLSMSKAIHYTSRRCEQRDTTFRIRRDIINVLEDQGYDIEKVEGKETSEGSFLFQCQLKSFKKKEIKKVIEILNQQLSVNLKLKTTIPQAWNNDSCCFTCETIPQINVDVATTSCFIQQESGDSTQIFQHAKVVYCVLSDGMGSGAQAKRVSSCISVLFEHMVKANIHCLEAMTCINQLLQGDAYATCDVCAFDTMTKSVIVCKSAANPTYLIRNHELYSIWGNSLPIGIVAHIEVDHIHIQVEKGDWFIMNSDGVELQEIKKWKEKLMDLSANEESIRFKEVLNRRQRSDDSTILLAKIV